MKEPRVKLTQSQRAMNYQKAARHRGLCRVCKGECARVCENRNCDHYRQVVAEVKCSCGRETKKRRLCLTHLEMDKKRKKKVPA